MASLHASGQSNSFPSVGNVGIGTSNPVNKLDVNGNIGIVNSSIPMGLMTELSGTYSPVLNMSVNFREPNVNYAYIGGAFRIDSREDLPLFQWLTRPAGQSGKEQYSMVLTKEGRLGIEATTPRAMLDVGSTIGGGVLGTVFGRLSEGG
ncbi:hypothetical protein [Pararcticibacter amylolyticus]|uniref:Uncharacterized protein n=1 Tax=Pararcticibacter amylolyticus TaxID=2173175 RepID=A0A2U2P9K6_9SPHI|nr:hypothetical protein [Pararcticibacter amylolyticus]PWG78067.1 hypothetical protein DDR33_24150 [Pararcticibacter amylolyticus]